MKKKGGGKLAQTLKTNPYKPATGIVSDGEIDNAEPIIDPDHEKGPEASLDAYKAWLVRE